MTKKQTKQASGGKSGVKTLSLNHSVFWYIIIPAFAFMVYHSVRQFDLVSWDDKLYVRETPMVQGLTMDHVKQMFTTKVLRSYNPLTLMSLALDYEIAKLDPKWSHLVNLIFHLLNALLVFACMRKMRFKTEVSGIIALLFAVHPLSTEAVAWVAGRKDMLYGFFFLLSWYFYLKFYDNRKLANYFFSLFLFLLSLFSKVQAITLPFILIISDYILSENFNRKSLLNKIPFIILSLVFGIVAISGSNLVADKYSVIPTFSDKIIYSLMAVGLYLYKIFLPFTQSAIYSFPDKGSAEYIQLLIGGIVATAGLIFAVIYSAKKSKIVAGGIAFFLFSVFVVLHVVAFNSSLIYERFAYMAGIGLFISVLHLDQIWPEWSKYKVNVMLSVAVLFAVACFLRVDVWKNSISLWTDVIEKNPGIAVGWNNRGMVYYDKGDYDKALSDFNESIRVQPTHPDAYNNRSIIYYQRKDYQKALEENLKLLAIDSAHKEGYGNRGSFFYVLQQYDSASYYYLKSTTVNPRNASSFFYAGVSEFNLKEYRNAIVHLQKAIEIVPNYADAFVFLGMTYVRLGNMDSVMYSVNKVESFEPRSPARISAAREYQSLGTEAFNTGDWQRALQYYNTSLEVNPNDADAYYLMGGVSLSRQDVNKAREYWRKALSINPQHAKATEWLGKIGN